jgi:hypothetical protein
MANVKKPTASYFMVMATLNATVQQFILPFTTQQTTYFNVEVEAAAVFALAEYERNTDRGLLMKQPDEKHLTLVKMAYPLWLFSKNEITYIFDGLNDAPANVSYFEAPQAKTFLDNLQKVALMREGYMTFLSGNANYFLQPLKNKQFTVKGLIADVDFKKEFSIYRNEATEISDPANSALLSPVMNAVAVGVSVDELGRLQGSLLEDAALLPECRRQINQTTSQYITELEFASQASAEEADAKIRAQEEHIKPQISKLSSQYRKRIKEAEKGYDKQIVKLKKLKVKIQKFMTSDEAKIKQYEHQAKIQASKHHEIYERRWKTKRRKTEKQLDEHKHKLNDYEKNIENLIKQKSTENSRLESDLNAQIKLARQPLLDLEAARDAKILTFKQETERLLRLEKPVVEAIASNVKVREPIAAKFESLGIKNLNLKNPALFYVPFYIAQYQLNITKRYLVIAPSIIAGADLSSKLRGVFNISKIGTLLTPRFKAVTPLVLKVPWLVRQNVALDKQFKDSAEKFNLLKSKVFLEDAAKGLVYLQRYGWLLDKEYELLSSRVANALSS